MREIKPAPSDLLEKIIRVIESVGGNTTTAFDGDGDYSFRLTTHCVVWLLQPGYGTQSNSTSLMSIRRPRWVLAIQLYDGAWRKLYWKSCPIIDDLYRPTEDIITELRQHIDAAAVRELV